MNWEASFSEQTLYFHTGIRQHEKHQIFKLVCPESLENETIKTEINNKGDIHFIQFSFWNSTDSIPASFQLIVNSCISFNSLYDLFDAFSD